MSGFKIDASEWRTLYMHSLQRTAEFVGNHATITPAEMQALQAEHARGNTIVAAWCAAGAAAVQEAVSSSSPVDVPGEDDAAPEPRQAVQKPNGAANGTRRGPGRPRGAKDTRPRRRRSALQADEGREGG